VFKSTLKFLDPYAKGKTVTRTIRIDEGYDEVLKYEADRHGVSVNTIMDHQLKKYVETYRFFEKSNAVTLSSSTLRAIIEVLDEDTIKELSFMLGKERPHELILRRGIQPSYESAKWYLQEILGDQSGWFTAIISKRGEYENINLSHVYGYKWSLFLQGYLKELLEEVLGLNPEVTALSASINFAFKVKEIDKNMGAMKE
jgi:hypothetical protein